ncbi:MAG: arylsulfotransferase family protein [Solirubrobacteraceae bacterium]
MLFAAALGAAAAPPALGGSGSAAAALPSVSVTQSSLRVIPFPGTPDAAPSSSIIFSALTPPDLSSVVVRGSRSGLHTGHLDLLPDHAGTAFVPDRPFATGEQVQVSALLTSPRAGTASGAPGATRLGFSFTIAIPVSMPAALAADTAGASPSGQSARNTPTQGFHSQQNFHPPIVQSTHDPDTSSGDIFLSPNNSPQVGAMIINSKGQLVWFRRVFHSALFNLEVQRYKNLPVLTWWHGNVDNGHGINGHDVIMGRSYKVLADLHAGHGYSSDLHEFQITSRNTALIDAFVPIRANLSSVGGSSNGTLLDNVIQELSIPGGQVLWEWHAYGHIPLSESHVGAGGGTFDFFHLNSIQQQPNRNLLISARNTWAVYLIGQKRGGVIWRLGGKSPSFHMGSGTNFEWQHDARMIGQTVSVFDDGALPQEELESSAKRIIINRSASTATLVHRYTHSPPLLAGSQGSAQTLSNHNVFVGWGSQPTFSEYSPSGQQVFNGNFILGTTSYRAYRFPWSGQPATAPSAGHTPLPGGAIKVYASWNGATQVASWRVLGGSSPHKLHRLDARSPTGFETETTIHSEPGWIAVQAVGSHGHVMATSKAHADRPHIAIFGSIAFVPGGGGYTGVPVGCYTHHTCSVRVTIDWGRRRVATQSGTTTIRSGSGSVVFFKVSPTGRGALARSAHHRIRVRVSARDSSGARSTVHMTLVGYSIRGSGPPRSASQSRRLKFATTAGFVGSSGLGRIVAACYAPTPCHVHATASANGKVIGADRRPQHLGLNVLGNVFFQLNRTGRTMLAHASGNQLAAQLKLSSGGSTATAHVDLIGYH